MNSNNSQKSTSIYSSDETRRQFACINIHCGLNFTQQLLDTFLSLEWDWIWGRKKDLKDHVYVKVLVGVRRSDENPKNYKPTVC
jgi:hypothetical protein